MSIWSRIMEALAALTSGEGVAAVLEKLRSPPQRSVAFTIAVIALGAKMAKADGLVTRDEVTAFREVFHISSQDEAGAARVFDLARKDVAGFETYAARIQEMFQEDPEILIDLMEGLFHIAMADGFYHPNENAYLEEVARIFQIQKNEFNRLRVRFAGGNAFDPYMVLGVDPQMELDGIRKVWRQRVRQNHPDAIMARGLPEEAVALAQKRMSDINRAWDEICKERG